MLTFRPVSRPPARARGASFLLAAALLCRCGKYEPQEPPAPGGDVVPAASASPSAAASPDAGAPHAGTQESAPTERVPDVYTPPRVIVDGQRRVYALTKNVWVVAEPAPTRSWIGFLWFGNSVPVREPEPRLGPGCKGAWYAIEPRGYVCVDEQRATLDPEHPVLRDLTALAPDLASPWPHRYGESLDLRRLKALPGELLPIPALSDGLVRFKRRSTVAWTREIVHDGRSFLLADDLWWVPKERVVAYPPVTFHGVHLGKDARLPLAFFRGRERPRFVRAASGELVPGAPPFARLSWVELSGRRATQQGDTYLETKSPGVFVRESDAVVPEPRQLTPWGTPLDADVDERAPSRGRRTWLEVSILGGWLLAYEDRTPVFATLVSAGVGGPQQPGRALLETSSTPTGSFKINGKFATATMVSRSEQINSAVPWAQTFSGPYALHSAYWHDDWGELKSGGCINVSPLDGRWLFYEFSEPRMPDNWHGMRWLPSLDPSTTLLIRR
jgi:L,D-transpeptidase-like protein